jgi:5'-nucleotidase / UDP-sugar diphosphatase
VPVDPTRRYVVGISDFLLTGGETNLSFLTRASPGVHDIEERRDVRLAVIDELRRVYR